MKLRLLLATVVAVVLAAASPALAKAEAVASGCRASALSTSSPTSWLPLLFAVGVVLVFVRRST